MFLCADTGSWRPGWQDHLWQQQISLRLSNDGIAAPAHSIREELCLHLCDTPAHEPLLLVSTSKCPSRFTGVGGGSEPGKVKLGRMCLWLQGGNLLRSP